MTKDTRRRFQLSGFLFLLLLSGCGKSAPTPVAAATAPDPAIEQARLRAEVTAHPTPEGHLKLGMLYYQSDQPSSAAVQFEKANTLKPHDALILNDLGAAYGAIGLYEKEIPVCEEALRIDPKFTLAKNNLAYAKSQLASPKNTKQARAAGFNKLGLSYYQAGFFENAIAAFNESVHLDTSNSLAWSNLGASHGALSHWQKEIDACRQSLKLDPHFELARNNLNYALSHTAVKNIPE
jgi:tetratricopeptide (TPR) repeat protein